MTITSLRPLAALALLFVCSSVYAQQQPTSALRGRAAQWEQMAAAEDARARTPAQLATLLMTSHSSAPELRRLAVRALGRLERADLSDSIAVSLRDPAARVRAEAAHALGQSRSRAAPGNAQATLVQALAAEKDSLVVSAIVETLGRLRYATAADAASSVSAILAQARGATALGALRGLFFLAKQPNARPALVTARATLLEQATAVPRAAALGAIRARTVAAATLVSLGPDTAALRAILSDSNPFVRREAAAGLFAMTDTAASAPWITRALADSSGVVRYDALRAYGHRLAAARGCAPIVTAIRDSHPHTALLAIDELAMLCPGDDGITALLDSIARALPPAGDGQWHRAAHALVALSTRAPSRASQRIVAFATHPNPFVRTYAATVAGTLKYQATLETLVDDADANVRAEAVEGLSRTVGTAAQTIYLAQLTRAENQVVMAAVAAIDSTTANAEAAAKLLDALDRLSATKRENSRDGRDAVLVRLRQVGSAGLADRLRPYLRDFDPQIAARAADALQAWTGTRPAVEPAAPPAVAPVTFAEASALANQHVIIQLASGGEVEVELFPFDAPTNAARFARLARRGYFDGLTLHRIAPNFVVQGGSPAANEYMGDALFSRDELAVENWRGTVGLSTRGRDTGDGQIYFNLIDNVNLDHNYTVFGRVVRGMEFVDSMLEGAVMKKVIMR